MTAPLNRQERRRAASLGFAAPAAAQPHGTRALIDSDDDFFVGNTKDDAIRAQFGAWFFF